MTTALLIVSASIVCQAVLWGAVLVGAKVNAPRPLSPIALPRRVPGHAHGGEQAAWDLFYSDVDVWQALYGQPEVWGREALTEPTSAYKTVGYKVPSPTTVQSGAAA